MKLTVTMDLPRHIVADDYHEFGVVLAALHLMGIDGISYMECVPHTSDGMYHAVFFISERVNAPETLALIDNIEYPPSIVKELLR